MAEKGISLYSEGREGKKGLLVWAKGRLKGRKGRPR